MFIDALANTFAKDLIKNNMVAPPTTAAGDQPFAAVASVEQGEEENSVVVRNLKFSFPTSGTIIEDFSLTVPRGGRVLLAGANGAGKTTLLQVLAGKYMVGQDVIRVLGRPAFHDIRLVSSGDLSYLGPQWRRDIAFAGNAPMQGDISAGTMIFNVEGKREQKKNFKNRFIEANVSFHKSYFFCHSFPLVVGVDPMRRARLISLLDIDLDWRLNKVSDGQRRRVQIAMGLLKPYQVLLLDEITVDMDVVGRLDLLEFFKEECRERGATIIYATHIFDGLEKWPTHVAYLENGKMVTGGAVEDVVELNQGRKLLHVVEGWLRNEKEERRKMEVENGGGKIAAAAAVQKRNIPMMPSKHMAFFR